MRPRASIPVAALLVLVVGLAACSSSDQGGSAASPTFDAHAAMASVRTQVGFGPRVSGSPGAKREARYIALTLRQDGIAGIRIQRPVRNVVAVIPGPEPGNVVVGAHYDTKDLPGFVGANDGASGVAVLLELARELGPRVDGQSVRLAFFDGEESRGPSDSARAFERSGDRGSAQYVRYARDGGGQGSPPIGSIGAMVLFDMVGDCDLRIPREATSDPGLYDRFAASAPDPSPFGGAAGGILDDHTPFEQAGIPSVDLIDFDYGPGPPPGAYWHTRQDDLNHVCASSLGAVGSAAAVVLGDFSPPG